MKKLITLLMPLFSILFIVAVGVHPYEAHATSIVAANWSWRVVPSPNSTTGQTVVNTLNGVAAVSAKNVWAVGASLVNGSSSQVLIEHWNGTKWQLSTPAQAPGGELNGVVALAANNVWAVGGGNGSTLIEHWNGSRWSVIPSPNPSLDANILTGVSAVSANDIWAVGYFFNDNNVGQTLTLHWNGRSWIVVPSPNVGTIFNRLSGVQALASNNVWASGYAVDTQTNIDQPLIEHWNGSSWKIVSTPAIPSAGLFAITATSTRDVWAVGMEFLNENTNTRPLIEHWNGTAWSIVTGPEPLSSSLRGISALSATNVWAVGTFNSSSGGAETLVEHWNGSNWALETSPSPQNYSYLNAVVAVTAKHVWAVGVDFATAGNGSTLTETRC